MAHFLSWLRSFYEPSIPARLAAIEARQQGMARTLDSINWHLKEVGDTLDVLDLEGIRHGALAEELKGIRWALEDIQKLRNDAFANIAQV